MAMFPEVFARIQECGQIGNIGAFSVGVPAGESRISETL